MTKRHWTIDEDKALAEIYPNQATSAVAQYFNRPIRAIHNRAYNLGIRKNHEFIRKLNTSISRSRNKFTTLVYV